MVKTKTIYILDDTFDIIKTLYLTMLLQLNTIQEIELLFYLVVIIIGIQLAIYFLYRYYKIRDERLPLNMILLLFGVFYLFFIFNAFILAINSLFISDPILKEIFCKFGYVSMLFSTIALLFFISIKEFSKIINIKIAKCLIIINLIPIIVVILLPSSELLTFLIVIIILSVILIYILIFQIRLINTSKGIIKNRLLLIFIGTDLSIISLFVVLEIIAVFYPLNILIFIGISLLMVGLIIVLLGVNSFPAFYELKWKENLLRLLIIDQKNHTSLYSYDFSEFKSKHEDYKRLFSGGITGIDSILSAITKTEGEKINKIKQADSLILLEYGTSFSLQITYALIVKEDLESNRFFLKSIKNQFEAFYKEILSDVNSFIGSEEQLFGSFDIIIKGLLY